jgi:hypothetical protein
MHQWIDPSPVGEPMGPQEKQPRATDARDRRLSAIQKKLDDNHAELLVRVREAEMADHGSVNPCLKESARVCLEVRRVAVKLLRGVRGLYAQFGLAPPPLCPDLQAESGTI